ncbi:hypothetical protein DPSP01_006653 [Paraphaeosphaeria sporulosa]|uniref:Prolyl 4-hydroxylase alpha subunit domain-containing protein n=1 Tax=Paraphaeosphaeria sporulosa TaxID=1460663 RepID=A0A177CK00_9PLEO|nr:uncharacterized protein CC84DRAFT_1163419 [Paraphaeosphaeria sporulosa]OAG07198.1 hypothetical protein CC84DRAFT_1163419 [Paraphaeosphaeria sporulosa]
MASHKLPEGFLSGPAPALKKTTIDFAKEGIPAYAGMYAVVLDGLLSSEECSQLISLAEATTAGRWERAMINVGDGQQELYEEVRKCGRIIWDSRELMEKLWARILRDVPEILEIKDWPDVTGWGRRDVTWVATRLNERARFLKYVGGEYFKAHEDGMYITPIGTERSFFTLHLYLNDAVGKDGKAQLKGGATTFHNRFMDPELDLHVLPKCGRVLIFQHEGLLHSGQDVERGTKYTMRTDIMYAVEGELGEGPEGGW